MAAMYLGAPFFWLKFTRSVAIRHFRGLITPRCALSSRRHVEWQQKRVSAEMQDTEAGGTVRSEVD